MRSLKIKEPTRRFSTQRTLLGWEVVDHDGRPVSAPLPSAHAHRISKNLNFAAYVGLSYLTDVLAEDSELLNV